MNNIIYVGLDVHKERISVGVADGRQCSSKPEYYGEVYNSEACLASMFKRLGKKYDSDELRFCYEAGPCGYALYRNLMKAGFHCEVIAPSMIPRKPGDRVKTDRRDSLSLARLYRAGELTPVWVPDTAQEAIRDLARGREDAKKGLQVARQTLQGFLLRHDQKYPGKSSWTQQHWVWLKNLSLTHDAQNFVLNEYLHTIESAGNRVSAFEQEMRNTFEIWSLRPLGEALMALRGIDFLTAMTIVAELGDLRRFETPSQLMGYLGLTPSEYSTGNKSVQGAITKAGNVHVRTALIESAWAYRLPARKSASIQRRAKNAPPVVQEIAWKAQKRLSKRFAALTARRKKPQKVVAAVARELCGFIWAIAQEVKIEPSRVN